MNSDQSIYVAGHKGMVGSAVVRLLQQHGYQRIITRDRSELDLTDQLSVQQFFQQQRPDVVVFAAARVGGILANSSYPAEFLYQNLAMASNAVHAAWQTGTQRFLFLGSTCIYPRMAPQPISEDSLLTSPIAKIAGLKLCQFYRQQYKVLYHSAMPTNLYGPGDNYHPSNSHVLPGLLRRFHEATQAGLPEVQMWGTGSPLREFLHVDDLAAGILHLLSLADPPDLVNIGSGAEVSILELAQMIAQTVGYKGRITHDLTKPDGTPRKLSDISRIRETGWKPRISLEAGLQSAYQDFLQSLQQQTLRSC
jgi:GDP-L-fucose synthase